MRIVVTGGAGFIGSHVAEQLLAAGHDVFIIDDLSTGKQENIPEVAEFFRFDIRDQALFGLFKCLRPDVVIHHAAQMSVRISIQEPLRDADINVSGSINLLEAARRSAVGKIIYASTGGALYGEPLYLPCDEEHPIVPLCHYGISKHTVEHYLELYRQIYDLDYTVLRYPNVYGPRQDPDGEAGVVAIFAGRMLDGLPVTIYGDGHQQRDFVYVDDIGRSNLLALERGSGAVINIGSNTGTSVLDIYEGLCRVTGYDQPPVYEPSRLGEVNRIYLSNDRAVAELGWSPTVSLADGLRATVNSIASGQLVVQPG